MGLFKNDKELFKKVEHLEDERKKLWDRLTSMEDQHRGLEESIKRTPAQSSKDASMYRNRAKRTLEEVEAILETLSVKKSDATNLLSVIDKKKIEVEQCSEEISSAKMEADEASNALLKRVLDIEKLEGDHPDLASEISQLESQIITVNDLSSKITATHTSIVSRKKEVDKVYYDIVGYTDEDEEGEEVQIEGLKDKLTVTYDELKKQADAIETDYDNKLGSVSRDYDSQKEKWEREHSSAVTKIKKLLPDALTAGLSSAYAEKRKNEEETLDSHNKKFSKSIIGMCVVSLIPLSVDIALFCTGTSLKEVLLQTPQMLSAILPLYIPILWIAYASNKKANLSKRLIEEYTHKEVMNKTYEGLSAQVESLEGDENADLLKHKLLTNMLEVSGENPGKLISDYNNSDHPLMDALDKSLQLSNALEKLDKVPGVRQVAQILDRKAKLELDLKAKKATLAMESNVDSDDETV